MKPADETERSHRAGWRVRPAVPADASAIAAVHVASWRSTYQGLLPDAFLESLSTEARETMWRRNLEGIAAAKSSSCLLVAEDSDGEIIGFASAGPEREEDPPFDGELYAIYLLREHQGHGVGKSLLLRAARTLGGRGCKSMRVWVLQGNPAKAFYERLGGVPVGEKTITIAGEEHLEIAYGWRDLHSDLIP